ncbi:SUKH-3 domain-containing protein [Streptomyces sp. NPDC021100]|uniref:SUKH-3 domain-containing protein n=1 Tax=Streptomyces sp. NPDC021100 TaxID=3365114 RepID=UPI0037A02672
MAVQLAREEIERRLVDAGWEPGRDKGAEADELVESAVVSMARNGYEVQPFPSAVDFVREFCFLRVPFPGFDPERDYVTFTIRHVDEIFSQSIAELSEWLDRPLFPVAYVNNDRAMALADPSGRFFLTHWSGDYYLGEERYEVLGCLFTGRHYELEEAP